MAGIRINEKLEIPEEDIRWSFARSSGPGGQNVNKVNSKATLRWIPSEGTLSKAAWNRFSSLAKRYVTADGEVVIQSQAHRDRLQNVDACRNKLITLVVAAMLVPKRRVKTKPSRAAKRRRMDDKRRLSDKKKSRQSRDLS